MAIQCTPGTLVDASKCLVCLSEKEQLVIQTYLLAVIAGGSTAPGELLDAAINFTVLSEKQLLMIQVSLLCQINGETP
jgi:hypothetical protein